mmetsp:Transcript_13014/g.28265  ORF Transcript_13014/g.28265 Transcript_13014/m.28265 type:complete len:144 (+) Transcript_13014:250-681(+)
MKYFTRLVVTETTLTHTTIFHISISKKYLEEFQYLHQPHHDPHIPSNAFTAALSSHLCFSNALSALCLSNPISQTRPIASSLLSSLFGVAYICTQDLAVRLNSSMLSKYIRATWASCGSFGSGEQRRAWRERRAVFMVRAGDH